MSEVSSLEARHLRKAYGSRKVVHDVSVRVGKGEVVGLLGPNGAGKTTSFYMIVGLVRADGGQILIDGQDVTRAPIHQRARMGLSYLPQEASVFRKLNVADNVRAILELQQDAQGQALSREEIEHKLDVLLQELRVDHLRDSPALALSGGERRRVELSRILFAGSDMLLLDEPTNHLDIDAKTWLLTFLRNYKGALLVISHDLDLLDEAITRVLHLDRPDEDDTGHVVEYRGTYTQYKRARAEDEARLAKKAVMQAKEVARLQEVVDRFGAKATKAAMAHSIEKRIARIESEGVGPVRRDRKMNVRFPDPPQAGETVIKANGLSKAYGGPAVFEDVAFDLGRGERLLVLGLNGAGKTSLLRILAGETTANLGHFEWGHNVSVGYFAQEHDLLDPHQSLLWHMRRELPAGSALTETQLRALLGMFGLQGEKVFQDSGTLSGGEKTKLALAMLMVGRNNVLLLDEPTNNLDPGSREAVAGALESWKGAIIMVSHDTEFVQHLQPTKVLLMPDGQVDYFSDDWLELVSLA